MGGYSSMALSENEYRVTFKGNAYTSPEQVQTMMLRRAAELTIQNKYRYFVIFAADTTDNVSTWTTPTTVSTNSYENYQGNIYGGNNYYNTSGNGYSNSYTTVQPGQTYRADRYTTVANIKMFNKKVKNSLDAKIILSNFMKR